MNRFVIKNLWRGTSLWSQEGNSLWYREGREIPADYTRLVVTWYNEGGWRNKLTDFLYKGFTLTGWFIPSFFIMEGAGDRLPRLSEKIEILGYGVLNLINQKFFLKLFKGKGSE